MNATSTSSMFEPKIVFYFLYTAENHPGFKKSLSSVSLFTGVLGLIGNSLCIAVLLRKSMRIYANNFVLLVLAVRDNVLILTFLYSYDCIQDILQIIIVGNLIPRMNIWVEYYPYVYPTWLLGKCIIFCLICIMCMEF